MPDALALPEITDQEAFNLERWEQLCADPVLADLDFRIETDRHGNTIMTPPPGFDHGDFQCQIAFFLKQANSSGKAVTECPISTSEGVKGADVVWISSERLARSKKNNVLTIAPEICVEVVSPSNSRREIEDKKRLYFEAGADEVWICDLKGNLFFFLEERAEAVEASNICPASPAKLEH
ncbi:MAG: Uma2 family endonuclease [Verrucomicrobiales bacterium]|jgi:Uma2 family endonuclease